MQRQNEDLVLVERMQSGDRAAFEKLYMKYREVILNYLYRMLNNREIAEEITQDALVKVYLNIHKYKPTGSFSSWVYAIARNLAKNEIRKLSRAKSVSLETKIGEEGDLTLEDVIKSKTFDAETVLKSNEVQQQIEKVLNAMPVKYREVITLCVIQKVPYEEAAEILKCSKSSVAIRLFRARKIYTLT